MKKFLIITAFCAMSINGICIPKNARLICDETYLCQTEKSVKIITSNETVKNKLLNTDFRSMSKTIRKDRHGEYLEYSFNYKAETFIMPKL